MSDRRIGDPFKRPRISDALIQTSYHCEHVLAGREPFEAHRSRTTLVYLCEDCRDKDHRLTMDGKVMIIDDDSDYASTPHPSAYYERER